MARTIKVKCNGPGKHVNEVDVGKIIETDTVLRSHGNPSSPKIPERVVIQCSVCTTGKVIVTREMIAAELSKPGGIDA